MRKTMRKMLRNWDLYLFVLPALAYFLIFHYWPMYGVLIAFKDYNPRVGVWASDWAGFTYFIRFFNGYYFSRLMSNTVILSLYQLIAGFPMPILLALLMNEVANKFFKKSIQFITYAPHFLSIVVLVGLLESFFHPSTGVINNIISLMGGERYYFMTEPDSFRHLYVWSGIWQNVGYGSIIYMAAIAGIDQELYEAANVDGASKIQKLIRITLPLLMPTAIILLILEAGKIMSIGFEKSFLMQNPLNIGKSDVISTYVYKMGLINADFSFSTAVGLFNSVINFALLIIVNMLSKRVSQTSLW